MRHGQRPVEMCRQGFGMARVGRVLRWPSMPSLTIGGLGVASSNRARNAARTMVVRATWQREAYVE